MGGYGWEMVCPWEDGMIGWRGLRRVVHGVTVNCAASLSPN